MRSGDAEPSDSAQPDDTALLLHTSGTTSRPKAVPLSHANLRASLLNIAATYKMTGEDRYRSLAYWLCKRAAESPRPLCASQVMLALLSLNKSARKVYRRSNRRADAAVRACSCC